MEKFEAVVAWPRDWLEDQTRPIDAPRAEDEAKDN